MTISDKNMILESIFAILAGYFLGSFPSAYIAARVFAHKDIREVGGGNMGTLNTLREIGFVPGVLVFVADVIKGVLVILIGKWLGVHIVIIFFSGLAAVIGNNYPAYLSFKGGRGGAVTFGLLVGLAPIPAAIAFGVMLAATFLTSNLRLALMAGFVAIPLAVWGTGSDLEIILYAIGMPLLLGVRMLVAERHKLRDPNLRKNLIVDHDYTPWQKRRSKS